MSPTHLYDSLTMPPALTKAHQALDRAVDAAYGKKGYTSDAERVAFLFELYQRYTSLLPAEAKAKLTKCCSMDWHCACSPCLGSANANQGWIEFPAVAQNLWVTGVFR